MRAFTIPTRGTRSLALFFILTLTLTCAKAASQQPLSVDLPRSSSSLELVRPTRPWEFMSTLGTRSGLLGQENGDFEAWVYPLKLLRNFHLRFRIDGEILESENLARTTTVRPESTTITYAWDTFSVKETLFAPVNEPGAVIQLEIDTAQPLEVEAVFERDFQLEWPGAMGGSDIEWNAALHAFFMDENQHKFSALIGSPSATAFHTEFSSNYANARENSIDLGLTAHGKANKLIIIAASFQGLPTVDVTYRKLATSYPQLLAESAGYYQSYLDSHVTLELPDAALQTAYQWAQVSVLQGLVNNPFLGTGLVAGFKQSSYDDQRPGYAWFFGRDAIWTSLALNAEGDYKTTRIALDFLSKYQRKDGKITHEIAQGASFVPWFQSMPYAYAAADATPLFIVAMEDYVRHSGDKAFAEEKWDNLLRAYQFLVSTYDENHVPKNDGIGHGWVEGGPLLPVKTELYQASVSTEALRALASLAHQLGKEDEFTKLTSEFQASHSHLDEAFWMAGLGRYAFALDKSNKQVDTTSVLATVPMWFGLLDQAKAQQMIHHLAAPEIQTAWGMRIIPETDLKYDPAGYHNGTVWPLFTGWASVGEYRYHQPMPAYTNLRSNALLTYDGSLGHVAEVLSGSYYQTLSSGSPHQIWSSAMVISPLLTGLFGLDADALDNHLLFNPHVPADWTTFTIRHVTAGSCTLDLRYKKTMNDITLDVSSNSATDCRLDFSPAFSLRTHVTGVRLNGHKIPFSIEFDSSDQHVKISADLKRSKDSSNGHDIFVIAVKNDFGLAQNSDLPSLGSGNEGLRVISETWSSDRNTLTLDTATSHPGSYQITVWNPMQIARIEGAEFAASPLTPGSLTAQMNVTIPASSINRYPHQTVVLHFQTGSTKAGHSYSHQSSQKGAQDAASHE